MEDSGHPAAALQGWNDERQNLLMEFTGYKKPRPEGRGQFVRAEGLEPLSPVFAVFSISNTIDYQ
jgi:hypothetical protein